jgi:hypothetical protein
VCTRCVSLLVLVRILSMSMSSIMLELMPGFYRQGDGSCFVKAGSVTESQSRPRVVRREELSS